MEKQPVILGITAFNHDASACLIHRGKLVAFSEEERFNGVKHTGDFPINSVIFCLEKANLSADDITDMAFYFNPKKSFLSYFKNNNPFSYILYPSLIFRKRFYYELVWLLNFVNKINSIKRILKNDKIKVFCQEHHLAHVWYGYFASGFDNCTVISNDSIGESISSLAIKIKKDGERISFKKIFSQNDPHSLGYLYGAVTEFLGFKRGSDEGKVMALAAYGDNSYSDYFQNAIQYLSNGKYKIGQNLLLARNFQPKGQRLSNKFLREFGQLRKREEPLTQKHYDIAYAVQKVTENILKHQMHVIDDDNIVFTGGIAQNSLANGKLNNFFNDKKIFIPPIPNDAGCSIGAAISLYYKYQNKLPEFAETAFLGQEFSEEEIIKTLSNNKIPFKIIENPVGFVVDELVKDKTFAMFRGKMECGPRALGHRSILASPINKNMKDFLNDKIKKRDFFQPYGGIILEKNIKNVFEYKNDHVSGRYMSFVYPVKQEWINKISSLIHKDNTARIQIIEKNHDPFLEKLLEKFNEKTGVPILINTSLNLRRQPMARTPQDCINTFFNSAIDYVLFNNSILVSK